MKKFNDILDCIWIKDHYYMLKNNIIEVYDDDLNYIKNLNIDKKYFSITYNDEEKSFYFCETGNSKFIYKSTNLQSFEQLKLNLPVNCSEEIKQLSYCKYSKNILITTNRRIFLFDLCRKHIKTIYEVKEETSPINDCISPLGYEINQKIILLGTICCCKDIYVAYRIGKISFISKLINGKIDDVSYKTCNFIKSIFVINNEIWILITVDCHQKLIYTGIDCDCCKNCECEIIESVALIEKSIAKILSSESLKIKAAIDKSENINDLICVNSSVSNVIYYVTVLEFILAEKLKEVNKRKDCD